MRTLIGTIAAAAVIALAAPAHAHTFGAAGAGLADGLAHPLTGLDHLLAMLAVGLWAGQSGGRARWALPAVFVAAMVAAGGLAMAGLALPMVEPMIAASVLVLGLLVLAAWRLPLAAGIGLVAAFAAFHGHAHGAELPEAAMPGLYALGFAAATVALHGVGLGLSLGLRNAVLTRALGAGIAAAGLGLSLA